MIAFDPSEIADWAGTAEAKVQLPRLIRSLILATVPTPCLLDMPSDSSVWSGGWDGLLKVAEGNPWVAKGMSAWEFSARQDTSAKATGDCKKRTLNTKGIDAASSTFVFATPRKRGCQIKKDAWIEERRKEGQWADIRVLDAADLAAWLERAPAGARWFAQLMGKHPDTGYIGLDEWRQHWTGSTQPPIAPELVLAGRGVEADAMQGGFTDKARCLYLQGDTREEAIAFLAASALSPTAARGREFLAKAVVVQTLEAWMSFGHHRFPLERVKNLFSPL